MKKEEANILIIDDELSCTETMGYFLRSDGYKQIFIAHSGDEAIEIVKTRHIDLAIVDIRMPGMDGFELMEFLKRYTPDTELIVISATDKLGPAYPFKAGSLGVRDFFAKPFDHVIVLNTLAEIIEQKPVYIPPDGLHFGYFIGECLAMRNVYRLIRKAATTDIPILITGESGTGKELVATAIHEASSRKNKPFVPFHCSAISNGLIESELFGHVKGSFAGATTDKMGIFEEANGGTLFLDEIGLLPQDIQCKLLRTLQTDEPGQYLVTRIGSNKPTQCSVRIIASSNEDLKQSIKNKTFRNDLYYSLSVFSIEIPPLRARDTDIVLLSNYFMDQANRINHYNVKISKKALSCFDRYSWPGNIRELRHTIDRVVTMANNSMIKPKDLPVGLFNPRGQTMYLKEATEDFERRYIQDILLQTKWNQAKAARILKVDPKTLWSKVRKLGITPQSSTELL